MASHTDQQPQNGSHLPAIDEVSLQEMILEATDTLIPLDVFRRSSSPVDHNHLNNRLDAEQGHTREVLGRETESNEHEALLGERPSRICSVCRGRNSTEPVPTETDVPESGSSDFEDPAELRRPTLFGHRLHKPLSIVQATQQHITNRTRQSRFHGWRMGVLSGCCMSTLVLGCNIALVVVGANRYGGYDNGGIADLMYGDELTISRWNTALHIFINILSSILLAGSNYTMQVLSSPTRQEIDRAHGRGDWLEVGILSLRNLRKISRNRAVLCLVLATSSIPLHLFYNASTFKIIAHNDYYVRALDIKSTAYLTMNSSTAYQNLSNEDWQSVYNRPFVSGHGNLYLVADWMAFNTTTNLDPLWLTPSMFLPWEARNVTKYNSLTVSALLNGSTDPDWIPYDDGQPTFSLQNATFKSTYNETIRPNLLHIAHAFSTPTNSQSRIQISFHFMMVVIAFNVFKLVVMMSVLITDRRKYIVTLGDASASFLEFPEPLTESCCLLSRDQIIHQAQKQSSNYGRLPKTEQIIIADSRHGWQPQLKSYYFSSTRVDRGLLALLSICSLCILLFVVAFFSKAGTTGWLWGASSQNTLLLGLDLRRSGATVFNAWLANMPQVLLSFCYLNLNTLCTAMACEEEWNSFTKRKGLRVTEPQGQQRSTYFLQLPYKWALPLIVVSTTLHWVLSQTFFLIRVDYFDVDGLGVDPARSESACGISFSSLAAFSGICLSLGGLIAYASRPNLVPGLPQAENCSLMISAACHPVSDEVEPHLKEVQWGVVQQGAVGGPRRVSLSSKPVRPPTSGTSYLRKKTTQNTS